MTSSTSDFGLLAGLSRRLEKNHSSPVKPKSRNSFALPHRQLSHLPNVLETEKTQLSRSEAVY